MPIDEQNHFSAVHLPMYALAAVSSTPNGGRVALKLDQLKHERRAAT
jgi:hypothetical protein